MTIEVILIDETQENFVNAFNEESPVNVKAIICNYGTGKCVSSEVLTMEGFEDLATYFDGATITEIETTSPF
jgi:hypothetical protein